MDTRTCRGLDGRPEGCGRTWGPELPLVWKGPHDPHVIMGRLQGIGVSSLKGIRALREAHPPVPRIPRPACSALCKMTSDGALRSAGLCLPHLLSVSWPRHHHLPRLPCECSKAPCPYSIHSSSSQLDILEWSLMQFCCLRAVWPWEGELTCLDLDFLPILGNNIYVTECLRICIPAQNIKTKKQVRKERV